MTLGTIAARALITSSLVSIALPVFSVAQEANDQEEVKRIDTIIVTAQRRDESLQDVPLSITAYSGDLIEELGIRDATDLTNFSPSLKFDTAIGVRSSSISVRGIGTGGGFNAGIDPSVGLYLDGVYIPKVAGVMQALQDVQTVELLKGPQGTLYGANSPAGVLAINTQSPSQDFEARFSGSIGNFDAREFSGMVSGGLTDTISSRLSFWSRDDSGWLELKQGGNTNSRSEYGLRSRTIFEVSENFELDLLLDYTHVEAECCGGEWIDISDSALAVWDRTATALGLDRNLVYPVQAGGGPRGLGERLDNVSSGIGQSVEEFDHWGISLRGIYDLQGAFEGHTLTATAAFRDFDSTQISDLMEVGVPTFRSPGQDEDRQTTTIEVQITSPSDQFFEYVAGLYYFKDDAFFRQQSEFLLPGCMYTNLVEGRVTRGLIPDTVEGRSLCGGFGRNDQWTQDTENISAYAQVTANFTDNWSITLGGRASEDSKEAVKDIFRFDEESEAILAAAGVNRPGVQFLPDGARVNGLGIIFGSQAFTDSVDNSNFTWSASTQYAFDNFLGSDDFLAYARVATGYKSPGINARPIRVATIPRTFDEETSLNYEVGVKSTWFGNRLQANVAFFQTNFEDLQLIASNPQNDPSGVTGTFVQNAGELENKGVELEYVAQPTNWLSLNGAVTYLDSEFVSFPGSPCPAVGDIPRNAINPNLCDLTGLRGQNTPEWRSSQSARIVFPLTESLNWKATGTWAYEDEHNVDEDLDDRSIQKAYSLFNASIGIESVDGLWEAELWGQNLTDEMVLTSTSGDALPGVSGTVGSLVGRFIRPRTYGVRATRRF